MSQKVPTVAEHSYTLSFAFTAPADVVEPLQVFWNGELLDELAAVGEEWPVYSYTVTAVDEEATLAFQGAGYVMTVE